jgi:hypothetical protein
MRWEEFATRHDSIKVEPAAPINAAGRASRGVSPFKGPRDSTSFESASYAIEARVGPSAQTTWTQRLRQRDATFFFEDFAADFFFFE